MRKILFLAMLFCSSMVFAENDLTTGNETDKELESVETEAPAVETVNNIAPEAVPQYYGGSNSSGFDYHKYIDAIYVNYGIIDGNHQFLGFDVGKDFFLDFNYAWGKRYDGKNDLDRYCIGLGVRPTVWFAKYFMFQAKIGAEYFWGTGYRAGNIACLAEPRVGVKIGSGGIGASYRFDVNKFKFRNTISGHICISAFFYI
jgi:hypothetical protein